MSFADHAILWLHITAAVFTIGPGTAAIMSTPRFIRQRNTTVVGYLFRTTRIYSFAALLVLVFGLILAGLTHKFSQWWVSASLTLTVVAFVLLILVVRDQGKALAALTAAAKSATPGTAVAVPGEAPGRLADPGTEQAQASASAPDLSRPEHGQPAPAVAAELRIAAVERGRIASIGGVTALIWLVILVFMVWH